MRRRAILKGMAATAGVAALGYRLPLAHAADYQGKLFVFVQADGAWDPTSFCDPKENTPGEPVINHWAEHDGIRQEGNIPYAPFADNTDFFEKYHARMLVINGVDAQTISHTVGIVHNWSGRSSEGYPTMSALLAARHGEGLPVAYLNFGGFSETGGIVRYTRINNASLLRNIARPRVDREDPTRVYVTESDWQTIRAQQAEDAELLATETGLLPGDARNRRLYASAVAGSDELGRFADAIPPDDELEAAGGFVGADGRFVWNDLGRQAQLAVLAFKTRVCVSADLWIGGFDTHGNHDRDHAGFLAALTQGVHHLWVAAEQHGVADRLVVVMGSDFGRTNHYNAVGGKDHWHVGSFVIMEKNQPWTNRVIGETDGLHYAYKIDPATLDPVGDGDPNGTYVHPKHVHKALRKYLGIETFADELGFPFRNTEDLAFFG